MDKVPTKINLSPYDDMAVRTLVGYINGDDQSNIDISFYALADLLDLARSLFIINLLRQLENVCQHFFLSSLISFYSINSHQLFQEDKLEVKLLDYLQLPKQCLLHSRSALYIIVAIKLSDDPPYGAFECSL